MNLIFQTWAHIKKDLLIYEAPLAHIKENKMKKKILAFCLLFTFACELNLGEEGEKKNNGGGCEIRI